MGGLNTGAQQALTAEEGEPGQLTPTSHAAITVPPSLPFPHVCPSFSLPSSDEYLGSSSGSHL